MFYFSLPILFKEIRLISPGECFLILFIVGLLLYFTAPPLEPIAKTQSKEKYLLNAWLGNLPLANVFWPFFVFLNLGFAGIDLMVRAGRLTVSSWDSIHLVLLTPILWWMVSVWRCSKYTHYRLWASLARLLTLTVPAEYALKLLIRVDYPKLFFNCEELFSNYLNCF